MKINLLIIRLQILIIFTILMLGIYAIYCGIALQADGSFFLLTILDTQKFLHVNNSRFFTTLVTQTPVLLAIKFGLKSINAFIYLYSFGLVAIPLLFWMVSLIILRGSGLFWLLLLAFSTTYLSSGLFAIGEFHLCYSLCAISTALLLRNRFDYLAAVLLIITALLLTLSYEAMLFLGPLLFAMCMIRVIKMPKNFYPLQTLLSIAAFLFAVSSAISAWSIIYPRDPAVLGNAMQLYWLIESKHFIYLVGMIILITVALTNPVKKINYWVAFSAIFASIIYIANSNFWNPAGLHYQIRSVSGLCLFVIFFAGASYKLFPSIFCKFLTLQNTNTAGFIVLLVYVSLAAAFVFKLSAFYAWAQNFEKEAISISTFTPINRSNIYFTNQKPSEFEAGWTNPCMSILLRGNAKWVLLNNTNYGGWQPFDPTKISANPLERYKKVAIFYN